MKKILILSMLVGLSGTAFAFDNECLSLLKEVDKNSILDKTIAKDSSKDWDYFYDDSAWKLKSPTNCKMPKTNYEKITCSDSSLIKLDKIAYATTLQNTINATGELLSRKTFKELKFDNQWINRKVADKESICLKLINVDQVKLKLKY